MSGTTAHGSTATAATVTHAGRDTRSPWRVWPLRRPAVLVLAKGFALLLAIWSGAGLLFMWLLDDGPVGDADRSLARSLEGGRTDRLNTLSTIGSGLSDTLVKVILVAVVGGTMVLVWRRWHDGLTLAVTVIFEASVFVLTSFIVGRERPPVEQLEEAAPSGSFPSGHAAAAVAFYVTLLVIAMRHTRNRLLLGVLWCVAVVVPIVVAVARTYRGMHHASDVIAGIVLGLASIVVVGRALEAGTAAIRGQADRRALPDHVTRLDLTTASAPFDNSPDPTARDHSANDRTANDRTADDHTADDHTPLGRHT